MNEFHESEPLARRPKYWQKSLVALLAISLIGVLGLASPASASHRNDRVPLRGSAVGTDTSEKNCDPSAEFALEMSGTLNGCLSTWVEQFRCKKSPDGIGPDRYVEKGREVFSGSISNSHGKNLGSGTFRTTYVLKATMAPGSNCDFGQQLSGGCVHPLVRRSGTGVFKNAKGTLRITDNIPNPPGPAADYTYGGRIWLQR